MAAIREDVGVSQVFCRDIVRRCRSVLAAQVAMADVVSFVVSRRHRFDHTATRAHVGYACGKHVRSAREGCPSGRRQSANGCGRALVWLPTVDIAAETSRARPPSWTNRPNGARDLELLSEATVFQGQALDG